MDEPYVGEIRPISFNYAPNGWALCTGQLLPIQQNTALYALLGTQFGGNGQTTFGLPDLRGRIPVGAGQLADGGNYPQGQMGGVEQVTLQQAHIPAHQHTIQATLQTTGNQAVTSPKNQLPAAGVLNQFSTGAANAQMGPTVKGSTGGVGGQSHENRAPFVVVNYVIALVGIYPSRQ